MVWENNRVYKREERKSGLSRLGGQVKPLLGLSETQRMTRSHLHKPYGEELQKRKEHGV